MKCLSGAICAIVFYFVGSLAALAVPISFTYTTLDASGTIDGVIFGTSDVTITATGDTDNRQPISGGGGWFIDHDTAQVEILGVGTYTFTTPTRTFVNSSGRVGFSRGGINGADLLNSGLNPIYAAYDLLTSIGPDNNILTYLQWTNSPVQTDAGTLVFNNSEVPGTFQAVVRDAPPVPLPAAGLLLLAGLGGLIVARRRR